MDFIERANTWLTGSYDEETKNEIKFLKENNLKELEDCFYRNLEFGTGGLRGVMGVGTNRMNKYTVGMATQGLADYLKAEFSKKEKISVAISFDSRNNSKYFAEVTSQVFAANDIDVYIYRELRPTPQLSFTIRHLGCSAGVMITASHNPKEYNGYKAYWEDGAQVIAPHDSNIIEMVNLITEPSMVKFSGGSGKIIYLDKETDELYLDALKSMSLLSGDNKYDKNFKIVYTPIHGTGVYIVPEALKRFGFENIINVPEQDITDGNFPTVKSPNPEESSALEMAIRLANETDADIVMATDPDADRIGIAVRDNSNNIVLLNGNQTASLLSYFILMKRREAGTLTNKSYMVKTIVTTDLLKAMADDFNVEMIEVLTGFKYIAEVVRLNEGKREFIGGGEESFGFNIGEFVRDKDAVISCCLFAEAASWARSKGKTLFNILEDIYIKYGLYKEGLLSLTKKGKEGNEQIRELMKSFREKPLENLDGSPVVLIKDFLSGECIDMVSDLRYRMHLPKSDVIQFISRDNTIVSVRPSGTEPKIKFYFGVKCPVKGREDLQRAQEDMESKLGRISALFSGL